MSSSATATAASRVSAAVGPPALDRRLSKDREEAEKQHCSHSIRGLVRTVQSKS